MENGLGARDAIEGLVELGEFFPLRFKFALFIFILLIYINLALIRAEKHWDWTLVRLILLSYPPSWESAFERRFYCDSS